MISAILSYTSALEIRLPLRHRLPRHTKGFTLVEMLVAISITLVMMATVVGVFATVSSSVTKRKAVIEVNGQVRHVRNMLQRDLEGITCPALPWTRPESNVGYFEIVEGLHADFYPSLLTDAGMPNPIGDEIDHASSTLPASNINFKSVATQADWITDGGGLGDYDDIIAFTSRNETEPFTGPAPKDNVDTSNVNNLQKNFAYWDSQAIASPVAEVIWYCVENPVVETKGYFGEAGYRTIYRRTLLVAPWLDYHYNNMSRPGVLRIMGSLNDSRDENQKLNALAALIAFQERYDISARIDFDVALNCWTIKANTLADLTKRENRYEHHGYNVTNNSRTFPYVMQSAGGGTGSNGVTLVNDPELYNVITPAPTAASVAAVKSGNAVIGYNVDPNARGLNYAFRPLAVLEGGATARAVVNEYGEVVYVTTGLVPLSITGPNKSRRGNDKMLGQALGFDVQVYDPDAPVYALFPNGNAVQTDDTVDLNDDITTVTPADLGWRNAAYSTNPMSAGSGAFVDLGYAQLHAYVLQQQSGSASLPNVSTAFSGLANSKSMLQDARLTRVYDTWNFGYENDGVNQDESNDNGVTMVDEGTDGFDSYSWYDLNSDGTADQWVKLLGPDDQAERETSPPYPTPLRAVQITLRVYEPDSGQIREVTVRQHFVPE